MQAEPQFKDTLPQDHPFYALLAPAMARLPGIFEIREQDHLSPLEVSFPLKMYSRETEDAKYATFIYFFTFPLQPEECLAMMRDLQLQKKVDAYME